ncbi:hypothetical protein ADUPG1_011790 [Aduncisulcus paluster]|uniref:Vicilin-like seed storage protein At2g18540 n=1 Tax=Aduncisulcus paluster TaxID=2918883 RepID=A0ABQ5K0G5_9EUKA|nr:hypothetical protein ADUPG1_011789 [Aduncisulcus paluster]GKT20917.1 hypothetical protein ADUPG1_011790 [Aduncisulcus paluster]
MEYQSTKQTIETLKESLKYCSLAEKRTIEREIARATVLLKSLPEPVSTPKRKSQERKELAAKVFDSNGGEDEWALLAKKDAETAKKEEIAKRDKRRQKECEWKAELRETVKQQTLKRKTQKEDHVDFEQTCLGGIGKYEISRKREAAKYRKQLKEERDADVQIQKQRIKAAKQSELLQDKVYMQSAMIISSKRAIEEEAKKKRVRAERMSYTSSPSYRRLISRQKENAKREKKEVEEIIRADIAREEQKLKQEKSRRQVIQAREKRAEAVIQAGHHLEKEATLYRSMPKSGTPLVDRFGHENTDKLPSCKPEAERRAILVKLRKEQEQQFKERKMETKRERESEKEFHRTFSKNLGGIEDEERKKKQKVHEEKRKYGSELLKQMEEHHKQEEEQFKMTEFEKARNAHRLLL